MPSGGDTQQRFVYSTVDHHGEIAASTAAVFLPAGEAPEAGRPVLAWAHGTTGMGDNCTPSAGSRNDKVLVDHWVDAGYAVVASDYTGMGTPGLMSYFNGEATAVSVVDSVIAAQKLDSVGAQLSEKWAVAGQSQGGGAALHVAHKASARSVEVGLDYRGAVATGAAGYIEEVMLALDPLTVANAFSAPLRSVPGLEPALRAYMATPTDGYDKPVFLGHGLTDIDVPSPIGVALNSEMWVRQFTGGNEQVEVHW
ncbi:alpha/beta hydrolase family protein [Corynebacterium variabile]|uniref:alpha/beta hydrolase family protein n=1 Tax=Corynebacterium variabile TaxID=1727 RepID=UPI002899F638|nr:lipase family protein [Corynebacterium variabile]